MNNSALKVVLVIVLALFIGTGIYTLNLYNDKKETEAQLNEEKQLVMNDLNKMAEQYDLAIGKNKIIDEQLLEAKGRIEGLIDSLNLAETNIKSLWKYKNQYLNLQKEMDVLLQQNESLKVENSLLATSLDSTKVKLEERNMFSDSLMVQNTQLAEVVENASVLTAVNLKGVGVIARSSGKIIPTDRARRSDKIQVCYTAAKNSLVNAGDKELYIQVIGPSNKILGSNQQISFNNGESINYSIISKFNYENESLNICEFIAKSNDQDFAEGRYTVNVYNSKNLIATTTFVLN